MSGRFQEVDQIPFAGAHDVLCTRYEWKAPFGNLKVRFLAPISNDGQPRRFWLEPVLESWFARPKPGRNQLPHSKFL